VASSPYVAAAASSPSVVANASSPSDSPHTHLHKRRSWQHAAS
jgi:hypothetical protein